MAVQPSLGYFMEAAVEATLGKEAIVLACLLECESCSLSLKSWTWENVQDMLNTKDIETVDQFIKTYPFFCMCDVLHNLYRFEIRMYTELAGIQSNSGQ